MAEEITQTISLLDQIKEVAKVRGMAQILLEAKKASQAEWELNNMRLLSEVATASEKVSEAESLLSELTIKAYNETGS